MRVKQVTRSGKRSVPVTTGRIRNDSRVMITRMATQLAEQSRRLAIKDAIIGHMEGNRRWIAANTIADISVEAEDKCPAVVADKWRVMADKYESKLQLLKSLEADVGCSLDVQPMACEMSADRKSLIIDGRSYDIPMADGSYGDGGRVSATEGDIQLDDELGDCLSDGLEHSLVEMEHSCRDGLKTADAAKHVANSESEHISAEEPKPAFDWMSMISQRIGSSHRRYTRKYTIGTDLSGDGIQWNIYI